MVGTLTAVAGIDVRPDWWMMQVVTPADAFADVLRRRAEIEAAVVDARESKRSVAAVAWSRDLVSGPRPTSVQELRAVARLSKPAGAPVVSEAVGVVRVLEWLVTAWKETEQVKNRRAYVENALGPVEPLPPSWISAIAAANENRLPL